MSKREVGIEKGNRSVVCACTHTHTHTHTHTPERNSRTTEEAVLGVGCLRNVPSSFGRAAGAGVAQGRYMPPCQALP